MHESYEAPGAIEIWAQKKGHDITHTRLYGGDALPEKHDFDFLVVMGGPQSPASFWIEYLVELPRIFRAILISICANP